VEKSHFQLFMQGKPELVQKEVWLVTFLGVVHNRENHFKNHIWEKGMVPQVNCWIRSLNILSWPVSRKVWRDGTLGIDYFSNKTVNYSLNNPIFSHKKISLWEQLLF